MRSNGRGATTSRKARRVRESLVVSEVALACVLLVFGGLLLKSFQQVLDVNMGFNSTDTYAWELNPSRTFPFEEWPAQARYFDQIAANVAELPGVEAVGLSDALPLRGNRTWSMATQGIDHPNNQDPEAAPHLVDWRYIDAMQIPLIAGRNFTADDTHETDRVMLVNETAARILFRGAEPLGQIVTNIGGPTRVVGVVGDVRHRSVEEEGGSEVYFPITQGGDFSGMDMLVRSSLPPDVLASSVAGAIRAADGTLPTQEFRAYQEVLDGANSSRRFVLVLVTAFAGVALLLAALGIYGVLSYSVTERLPEIGIRMALGESAPSVSRRVVGRTLGLAAIGVTLGVLVSLAGTRSAASLLFGVEATDPLTFVGMAALLMGVAALAGIIPAQRAARADSASALRAAN